MENYLKKMVVSKWFQISVLLGLFIILSLITIAQYGNHQIVGDADFIYHMSRIEAFAESIRAHQWFNFRNFVTFNQIGVANNYFYPYVYDWLWGLLFVVIGNPIRAYYVGLFCIMLVGLTVSYVSVLHLSHSRLTSLIATIFYLTTPYHVFILNGPSVLGEALAATFIPLYVLGARELLRGPLNRWWLIAVALALTAYAHLITLALEIVILMGLYLWSLVHAEYRWQRFVNCLKAASLFAALTSFFWVPFIQLYLRTPIQATTQLIRVGNLMDFGSVINMMLTNSPTGGITANPGLAALVAIGLMLRTWKKLSRDYRIIGLISFVLLLASTSLFPWYLLPQGIQNVIQFPYRLYGLTSFGLILTGSASLTVLIQNHSGRISKRQLELCTILISVSTSIVLFSSLVSFNNLVMSERIPYTELNAPKLSEAFNVRFKLDVHNYQTLFKSPRKFYGTIDYAPLATWQGNNQDSLIAHQVLSGHERVMSTYTKNVSQMTYYFKLKNIKQVDIPVLHYGTERVVVNGQPVKAVTSRRGSTLILGQAGTNTVTISEPRPVVFVPLLGLSLLTWGALIAKLGGLLRRRQGIKKRSIQRWKTKLNIRNIKD